jgi:hypothetical protein
MLNYAAIRLPRAEADSIQTFTSLSRVDKKAHRYGTLTNGTRLLQVR